MFNYFLCETEPKQDYTMLVVIGIIVLMIVMNIISQRKQSKQINEMLARMDIGAKVMTRGGLIGTIVEINVDNLILDIGTATSSTLITIDRNSVYYVYPSEEKVEEITETASEEIVAEEVAEEVVETVEDKVED
ncbi:MAG: preprotein translocase subunit YajC [Clostridia bacterium]|nr:preprotein translocase subunit YajC [Clostridia bacterium]